MFIECHVPVTACITKQKILSLFIIFVITKSVDPDEMSYYTAFHLGLHCLQKYVISIQKFNIVKNEPVYKMCE